MQTERKRVLAVSVMVVCLGWLMASLAAFQPSLWFHLSGARLQQMVREKALSNASHLARVIEERFRLVPELPGQQEGVFVAASVLIRDEAVAVDQWGESMLVRLSPDVVDVISSGADRMRFTDDDIHVRIPWQ